MDQQREQQRLHLALDAARMRIWDSELADGRVALSTVKWDAPGAMLLGLPPELRRQPFRDFLLCVHADDRALVVDTMQAGIDSNGGYEVEYRVLWPDGSLHWLAAKAEVFRDAAGVASDTLGIIWDITARKRDELRRLRERELAETTLRSIGEGVITTDRHGRTEFMNRVAEHLTGWPGELARGRDIRSTLRLIDEAGGPGAEHVALKCLRLRQAINVATSSLLVMRDGGRLAVEESAAPIWADDGELLGTVVVFRDVSHERKLSKQLSWQATHDTLTGLLNRHEFEAAIAAALHSAKHDGHVHALLYLDLDQFKVVNDTCGHSAGDLLLQLLAKLLPAQMRDSDILARLGGDELGVLLPHCPHERALHIADSLRLSIKNFRFVWANNSFELGVRIGMVEINDNSKSTTELLIAADQACYQAKEGGRNRVHRYQESDVRRAQRHGEMLWVSRLNDAFARQAFRLYAQPIVHLNGRPEPHDEVLIRIENSEGGLILPGAFIPAAERYDLMTTIDRWVISAVCRHLQSVRDSLPPELACIDGQRPAPAQYSINLSGTSLGDEGLHDYIIEQFVEHAIAPEQICFEITETAVIANLPQAQTFMSRLQALGCRFSLDDFGSGLSSFAYLKRLPVDFVKIDGQFVRDIATDPVNLAMVEAVHRISKVMGMQTIAELVETEAAFERIRAIGVDYCQGYYFGELRPLTAGSD